VLTVTGKSSALCCLAELSCFFLSISASASALLSSRLPVDGNCDEATLMTKFPSKDLDIDFISRGVFENFFQGTTIAWY